MIRFSLATLFLLVLLAALGCAALMYASPLVKQIAVTAAALVLVVASLVALFGRGQRRALAGGFAFVGWVYLLLAFSNTLGVQQNLLTRNVNGWLYDQLHAEPLPPPPTPVRVGTPAAVRWNAYSTPPPVGAINPSVPPQPAPTLDPVGSNNPSVPPQQAPTPAPAGSTVQPQPAPTVTQRVVTYQYTWQTPTAAIVPVEIPVDRDTFNAVSDALWSLLLALLGAVLAGVIHARSHRPQPTAAGAVPEPNAGT